jgi:hypothetical protein
MPARTSRASLLVITAALICGCSQGVAYNEPTDPSKEAAAIGAGTMPPTKVAPGRKKVTKPPGPTLKGTKSVQPLD